MAVRSDGRRARRIALAGGAVLVVVLLLGAAVWVLLPHYRPGLRAGERHGIDVSSHQGQVDWPAVAADRISFAYLKATEGGDLVDPTFARNWAGTAAAGLDRGAYHFFTLCRPGADQARNFLAVAAPDRAALPPAVDLELNGNCARRPARADLLAELRVFLEQVEAAWGRPAVIYTNDDFAERYPVRALGRELWEAPYYRRPADDADWAIWQVTSRARVDGVDGYVDLDLARRTG